MLWWHLPFWCHTIASSLPKPGVVNGVAVQASPGKKSKVGALRHVEKEITRKIVVMISLDQLEKYGGTRTAEHTEELFGL